MRKVDVFDAVRILANNGFNHETMTLLNPLSLHGVWIKTAERSFLRIQILKF